MLEVRVKKNFGEFAMDMDFSLDPTGITVFFGKSGAGKTTLVNMIAGLVRPDQGVISCGGREFFSSGRKFSLPPEKRGLGYVFQQCRLFPHLSVRNNILFGPRFCGRRFDESFFQKVVEVLGVGSLLERRPNSLSGGESQRVAIGRALLSCESFLLMDEPLSSLDIERKEDLIEYIASIPQNFGIPVIYVTHSKEELSRLADRVLLISGGRAESILSLK
ncbi:MAG: ATP-binding cassette domain-containing protein [Synergistaceae bacterium]|nr:ATP-binding cassette domain-containing protein [Synergistaceae bacterium]